MKVIRKQTNSYMCIICGVNNEAGLKAPFYEMEDKTVISLFTYRDIHQSYPERTHGGMIACMLDEIVGRAIWIYEPNTWGVTMTINIKYLLPTPLNEPLKGIGRIIKNTSRTFMGTGEIYDQSGRVLAKAEVTYLKMSLDKIASAGSHEEVNLYIPDSVKEID